jgi:mannitol/fructose-specific phosphotransferase system IIA component (Ntr-type)
MRLSQIVSQTAIVAPLQSVERDAVIGELLDALVRSGAASESVRDELLLRVLAREKMGSTGFGRGVAVPHVKHSSVRRMSAALGVTPRGIDFNSLDRQPVYSVFLLLSPEDQPEEHLLAMEAIFKNLSKDTFRRFLRQASSPEEVWVVLEEADGQHLA